MNALTQELAFFVCSFDWAPFILINVGIMNRHNHAEASLQGKTQVHGRLSLGWRAFFLIYVMWLTCSHVYWLQCGGLCRNFNISFLFPCLFLCVYLCANGTPVVTTAKNVIKIKTLANYLNTKMRVCVFFSLYVFFVLLYSDFMRDFCCWLTLLFMLANSFINLLNLFKIWRNFVFWQNKN